MKKSNIMCCKLHFFRGPFGKRPFTKLTKRGVYTILQVTDGEDNDIEIDLMSFSAEGYVKSISGAKQLLEKEGIDTSFCEWDKDGAMIVSSTKTTNPS